MIIGGAFCISLDFEKFWGVHDIQPIEAITHFQKVESIVFRLLDLFDRYDIHATWAIVGLLGEESIESLRSRHIQTTIPYAHSNYSPFPLNSEKYGDFPPDLLLAKREITKILEQRNQELASHTYSHFYCCEEGVSPDDFHTDYTEMKRIFDGLNTPIKSIIFPRNQVESQCLKQCVAQGVKAYRGNQENRFWRNSRFKDESLLKKVGRVLDAYFPLSKTRYYRIDNLKKTEGLVNIPANRFFRAYTGRNWLEKRKISRIKKEMTYAAEQGQVYHLWWHPHNFAIHPEENLEQIEDLLAYANELEGKFGFLSLNMSEISRNGKE